MMKKRILSLLLILSMLMTAVPMSLLPILAVEAEKQEEGSTESFDYDALYVKDAVLRFDFFDKDSKDEIPSNSVLYEDEKSGVKITLSSTPSGGLHYGNGYLILTGGASLTASGVSGIPTSETPSVQNTHQIVLSRVDESPKGDMAIPTDANNNAYLFRFGTLNQFTAFRAGGLVFKLSYITKENAALQREYNATIAGAKNNASQQIGFSYPVRASELAVLKELDAENYITTNNGPGEEQATWAGFSYLISNSPYKDYPYYYRSSEIIPDNAFQSGVCKTVVNMGGGSTGSWIADLDTLSSSNQGRTLSARDYGESYTLTSLQSATYTSGAANPYSWNLHGFFVDAESTYSTLKNITNATAPTDTNKNFVLNNYPSNVYAIRAYNRLLNQDEIVQNMFADVAKYFELDLTDYLALDAEKQALVRADVASSIVLHHEKEVAESLFEKILDGYKPFAPDEYEMLYVTDADNDGESDLIFWWDAFSLTEDGVTPGAMKDKYDRHSLTFSSGTAGNGSFDTVKNINFSSVIQKDKNGDYPDLTVELSMKPLGKASSGNRVSPKFVLGPVRTSATSHKDEYGIFSSVYRAYRSTTETTVSYFFDDSGKILKNSKGSAYTAEKDITAAGLTYVTKVDIPCYASDQLPIGENWGAARTYFYNPIGESYSLDITLDFTVSDLTNGLGSMKMVLWRDGAVEATKSNYSYFRGYTDYSAKNVPETVEQANTMKTQTPYANMAKEVDDGTFSLGGNGALVGYQAFRVYDAVLTEKQINQNHFADLLNCYRPEISHYLALDAEAQEALWTSFAAVQYDEIDRVSLENAMLNAYIIQYFDGVSIDSFVSFDGFQVRLYGEPALRARFTLNKEAFATLGEEYTIESIGVIAASADDYMISDLKLIADEDGNYTAAADDMYLGTAYAKDLNNTFEGEDGKTHFSLAVTYEGEAANGLNYIKSLRFRAYMVLTRAAGTAEEVSVVQYCDAFGDTEGVGEEVSLSELSMILKANGSQATAVNRVCASVENLDGEILSSIEEFLSLAAQNSESVLTTYQELFADYETCRVQMTAQQKNALKAQTSSALSAAKNAAQQLLEQADASYAALTAYMESEDKQEAFDYAKTTYDKIVRLCNELSAIAEAKADAELKATAEEKIAEAKSYYQGLYRKMAEDELTVSRYKRKISESYSTLSGYALNTTVKSRMYILGDSTVCPRESTSTTQGWPQIFAGHITDELEIINYAVGGWSFKGMIYTSTSGSETDISLFTDMENSRFGKVLDVADEGDYVVFASTSPNDLWQGGKDFFYKTDEFGNMTAAVRSKDSNGDTVHYFEDESGNRIYLTKDNCARYGYEMYTWKASANEYYHMLKECIDKTLKTGATPVLVTAVGGIMTTENTTKTFTITRDGVTTTYTTSIAIPGKIHSNVEHYEEVKRILAEEYGDRVVLIDYAPAVFEEYEKSFDEFVASGMTKDAALLALRVKYNPGETDPTHQNVVGATLACDKIIEILRKEGFDCDLKQYLKTE